ncbi:hypothetical protein FA15DRAFT_683230 [Coprinopsis marcescibilis]|uniref:DNA breaking-rejoining enzyme n=1 Tax=Coprinopsis marcescibilis TaxID=230819 RepID=A0A5C3KEX7_COPMA|nr:hypothetical protein FA15DRAFT_683230 [Coprinopsis marcescibilis]
MWHPSRVPSKDRLRLWMPVGAQTLLDDSSIPTNLTDEDLQKLMQDLEGLLAFHVFCNKKGIAEEQRAPVSLVLMLAFASSLVGAYAGLTARNYVLAVRAWQILHGIKWQVNDFKLEALLKSAQKSVPATSRKLKQEPFTVDYIARLREQLDPQSLLHMAVYACLTTIFYSMARVGEFMVRNQQAFNPVQHVKLSDVQREQDRQGRECTVFHIPVTKVSTLGEDVMWAKEEGVTDPEAALSEHMCLNNPPADGPLFPYVEKNGNKTKNKPLMCSKFLKVIKHAAKAAGMEPLKGHGICIGSTLEYLLQGIPFEVMKTKGRWGSDAFLVYLWKHAQILAPYIQAHNKQNEEFIWLVMPPICR